MTSVVNLSGSGGVKLRNNRHGWTSISGLFSNTQKEHWTNECARARNWEMRKRLLNCMHLLHFASSLLRRRQYKVKGNQERESFCWNFRPKSLQFLDFLGKKPSCRNISQLHTTLHCIDICFRNNECITLPEQLRRPRRPRTNNTHQFVVGTKTGCQNC